jgi:hypothetical protein
MFCGAPQVLCKPGGNGVLPDEMFLALHPHGKLAVEAFAGLIFEGLPTQLLPALLNAHRNSLG